MTEQDTKFKFYYDLSFTKPQYVFNLYHLKEPNTIDQLTDHFIKQKANSREMKMYTLVLYIVCFKVSLTKLEYSFKDFLGGQKVMQSPHFVQYNEISGFYNYKFHVFFITLTDENGFCTF